MGNLVGGVGVGIGVGTMCFGLVYLFPNLATLDISSHFLEYYVP